MLIKLFLSLYRNSKTNNMLYRYNKENLIYERIGFKTLLKALAVLFTIVFVLAYYLSSEIEIIKTVTKQTKEYIVAKDTFSDSRLKEYILDLNLKYPSIVYAQAVLESNHFKSKIFKENNNFFGMKCAMSRPTTNNGENRGHAVFETWKECILDYALFQAKYLSRVKNEAEYLAYLGEHYAEDPNYVNKLKKIMEKFGSLK